MVEIEVRTLLGSFITTCRLRVGHHSGYSVARNCEQRGSQSTPTMLIARDYTAKKRYLAFNSIKNKVLAAFV
jgi:hypothetical protein